MNEIEKIIEDIDQKVRCLVSNCILLEENLLQKEKEIEELRSQIINIKQDKENLINKENKEYNINNDSDINKSKILIDDLLKKINRSISIISKDNYER